jgi:hypothetical protein
MSVKIMSLVFDHYPGPPAERFTALALADHASHDGENVYPSVNQLALKTGHSERAVQYHLRRMEARGWLEVVEHGGGRGKRTKYRIPIEKLKGAAYAPFPEKRVQIETEKGADGGVHSLLEPSLTVSEQNALFARFWFAYPKKKNKGIAEKAFRKLRPDETLLKTLLKAIEIQKRSQSWTKDNGQFIPYPASWLNAKAWEDEEEPTEPSMFEGAL